MNALRLSNTNSLRHDSPRHQRSATSTLCDINALRHLRSAIVSLWDTVSPRHGPSPFMSLSPQRSHRRSQRCPSGTRPHPTVLSLLAHISLLSQTRLATPVCNTSAPDCRCLISPSRHYTPPTQFSSTSTP
ncbi:hypothetical protein CALVIDRAFT_533107 [Calocera viscosa TUFC12733]|uniref:Uncharacterized protein n=1 Tax=Calocera viscosa (strain TUFC12733) TaxID=1330018 RepID=A0A167RCN3_CALVF|nr:hypothetical protein CALVIDRAFT_533107 [Calocera viscosa TUFC12733]